MTLGKATTIAPIIALVLLGSACNRLPRESVPDVEGARGAIAAQEEAFRAAKLRNDVPALNALLADDYVGLNHNGNVRTKRQALELFRTFTTKSLTVKTERMDMGPEVAVVTGSQVERTCEVDEDLLFLRVYVSRSGRWQLLGNTQFRRPPPTTVAVGK